MVGVAWQEHAVPINIHLLQSHIETLTQLACGAGSLRQETLLRFGPSQPPPGSRFQFVGRGRINGKEMSFHRGRLRRGSSLVLSIPHRQTGPTVPDTSNKRGLDPGSPESSASSVRMHAGGQGGASGYKADSARLFPVGLSRWWSCSSSRARHCLSLSRCTVFLAFVIFLGPSF